jgi:hypothetical protein
MYAETVAYGVSELLSHVGRTSHDDQARGLETRAWNYSSSRH